MDIPIDPEKTLEIIERMKLAKIGRVQEMGINYQKNQK